MRGLRIASVACSLDTTPADLLLGRPLPNVLVVVDLDRVGPIVGAVPVIGYSGQC